MKLPKNPNPTKGIEARWRSQFNKRFRDLKASTRGMMKQAARKPSAEFPEFFNKWFSGQLDEIMFGFEEDFVDFWQNQYIDQAFNSGASKAFDAVQKAGYRQIGLPSNRAEEARLLYQKSFEDLKGIVSELKAQASRAVITEVSEERTKTEIQRAIFDRVDKIGRTRSHILANTRTAEAFNVAEIAQAKSAERDLGAKGKLRWITQQDERVRPRHRARHGKLYTPKQASRMIGEPNCRCGVRLEVDAKKGREQKRKRKVQKLKVRKVKKA